MKNSNKWLLAAVLVLLTSLTAYNMALRAEYRKGTYQDPLRDYLTLDFKNFTEVAVPSASTIAVQIVPGPFRVRMNPNAADIVHLSQQGQRLIVRAAFPEQREHLGYRATVVISCPRLAVLTTDAVYKEKGTPKIDSVFSNGRTVQVQGFRQDSLNVYQDRASRVQLTDNNLGYLRVVAGASSGSGSSLLIDKNNRIGAANLDIRQRSELTLNHMAIASLRYHFSDSARISMSGAAMNRIVR